MNRLMIVARLKPGTHEQAEALLEQGPPFDPQELGFHRHSAHLTSQEVVFVFEAPEVEWIVNDIIDDALVAATFEPWQPLVDGVPRVAHERYFWSRGRDKLGVGLGT
jgi:hypothetical protein